MHQVHLGNMARLLQLSKGYVSVGCVRHEYQILGILLAQNQCELRCLHLDAEDAPSAEVTLQGPFVVKGATTAALWDRGGVGCVHHGYCFGQAASSKPV